jgi:hypothetical protein
LLPEVTHAAGQALEFSVDNSTGVEGATGVRATVTVDVSTGRATYRPPPGRMSQFRSGAANLVTFTRSGEPIHDRFTYTVRYRDDPTTFASAQVTVPIEGDASDNVSFQSLYADPQSANDWDGNCATCHSDANAYPAFKWYIEASARNTYCRLRASADSNTAPNFDNAYVNLDDPGDSALYLKPRGELEHQGTSIAVGTSVLHARILQWIREGGNYTSAANQDCAS